MGTQRADRTPVLADLVLWALGDRALAVTEPGHGAAASIELTSHGSREAGLARILGRSPVRDEDAFEERIAIRLPPGTTRRMRLDHQFAEDAGPGLYALDIELLDESGAVLQARLRSAASMSVGHIPAPPSNLPAITLSVVAPEGERYTRSEALRLLYVVRNWTRQARRLRLAARLHSSAPRPAPALDFDVAPDGTYSGELTVQPAPGDRGAYFYVIDPAETPVAGAPKWFQEPDLRGGLVALAAKGIRMKY